MSLAKRLDKLPVVTRRQYLWVDDMTFVGRSVEVGDDVAIQAGVSFRF